MKRLIATILLLASLAVAAGALVRLGAFNVAADEPHSAPVNWLLESVRTRSIAARSSGVTVPALDDPALVRSGAEHYAQMCTGCHLAPGMRESELREGMYPKPPDLTAHAHASPAQMFWVIKHGIKMSGMPAWGRTHDDASIWGLVAFVQVLPELSPEDYRKMVPLPAHGAGGAPHEHGVHSREHAGR
jgi:mono/diheme cytochrome c family protein